MLNARPENYLIDEMPPIYKVVDPRNPRRFARVVLDPSRARGPFRGPLLRNPLPSYNGSP